MGRVARIILTGKLLHQRTGRYGPTLRYFAKIARHKLPMLMRHAAAVLAPPLIDRSLEPRPQISFLVSGGIGDFIVMARFLRDMQANVEDFVFDIYASMPAHAAWVFGNVRGFRACYPDMVADRTAHYYDAGLILSQFVVMREESTRWGELRQFPRLLRMFSAILRFRPNIDVFVHHHPRMDNFLARKAVFAGFTRRDYLHHIASIPYGGDRFPLPVVAHSVELPRPYITIHNGFDPGFVITGTRATKCYPHFDQVVTTLKRQMPDLKIVQVGTSTSVPIANVDYDLINKTTLSEVAGLIKDARLHLDNEGGLVHLAACLGVKSCVIFGPTPADFFGYETNINVAPPVCGGCWWIDATWMDFCPRKFAVPICMDQQNPDAIAARVIAELETL